MGAWHEALEEALEDALASRREHYGDRSPKVERDPLVKLLRAALAGPDPEARVKELEARVAEAIADERRDGDRIAALESEVADLQWASRILQR